MVPPFKGRVTVVVVLCWWQEAGRVVVMLVPPSSDSGCSGGGSNLKALRYSGLLSFLLERVVRSNRENCLTRNNPVGHGIC